MSIVSDEEDSDDAMPGESVKLKISGVEEEVFSTFSTDAFQNQIFPH